MPKTKQHTDKNICGMCGNKIRTMCFRGTGICGENCRKKAIGGDE